MDDDNSIVSESFASESEPDASTPHLQELTNKISKAFVEHRIGESSLGRSNAKVLRIMCQSRGLSIDGTRADLAARLIDWV